MSTDQTSNERNLALKHFPMRDEMLATARTQMPAGRLVTPEDVAARSTSSPPMARR